MHTFIVPQFVQKHISSKLLQSHYLLNLHIVHIVIDLQKYTNLSYYLLTTHIQQRITMVKERQIPLLTHIISGGAFSISNCLTVQLELL